MGGPSAGLPTGVFHHLFLGLSTSASRRVVLQGKEGESLYQVLCHSEPVMSSAGSCNEFAYHRLSPKGIFYKQAILPLVFYFTMKLILSSLLSGEGISFIVLL